MVFFAFALSLLHRHFRKHMYLVITNQSKYGCLFFSLNCKIFYVAFSQQKISRTFRRFHDFVSCTDWFMTPFALLRNERRFFVITISLV